MAVDEAPDRAPTPTQSIPPGVPPTPTPARGVLARAVLLAVLLASLWLLASGMTKPLILAFGVGSVLGVVWLSVALGVVDEEGAPTHLLWRMPRHSVWLGKEVLLSNLDMARRVLWPAANVRPRVIELEQSALTPLGQALYGQGITLTPGTVTLSASGDRMIVHAIHQDVALQLAEGAMHDHVADLARDGEDDA